MATESNRDKARRGGWGTGEVLSVGAVAVDRASGPDFTGRTVHVAGAPSCNQTLTIGVDGQHVAVSLLASDTAEQAARKVAAALEPRYEARGSTVVEQRAKPIEPVPGKTSVEFIDVAAWAILVNPSPWGAVWAAFLGGGGGQPAPAPLDAAGERLDTRKGYMMLSPPGESVDEACRRVEGGTAPKGEEVRS